MGLAPKVRRGRGTGHRLLSPPHSPQSFLEGNWLVLHISAKNSSYIALYLALKHMKSQIGFSLFYLLTKFFYLATSLCIEITD